MLCEYTFRPVTAELFAEEDTDVRREGGDVMPEFSDKHTCTSVRMTEPRDQAYAARCLVGEMGRAVTGQTIQVDDGQFL